MELQKIKDIISDLNFSDDYAKEIFRNIKHDQFNKEESAELLVLFQHKRPHAHRDLLIETASEYM